jgi:hypothetical protein
MEKSSQVNVFNSKSYSKRHKNSYIRKTGKVNEKLFQSPASHSKVPSILTSHLQDEHKSSQTPDFDISYENPLKINSLNSSLESDSSQRISSPQLQQILKNYSKNEGKVQVKTVLTKQNLENLQKIPQSVTPSPYFNENPEKKKPPSIQLLKFGSYKKNKAQKDFFFKNTDDSTILTKQIEHYEKIIQKQSEELSKMKLNSKKSAESRSKSISPSYAKFKQSPQYANFWNLKESQFMEPKHLHEMEGFKNLWICNIESKIINPQVGPSKVKKIPSSIINRYKYLK